MAQRFTIGRLAAHSGCKVPTIRYYEQIGLMAPPDRSEGNQRLYDAAALQRLAFIRHARDLGFTLDDIRDLLTLSESPDLPCAAADAIARRHLSAVRDRIESLRRLEGELEKIATACQSDTVRECRVIEMLGREVKGSAVP
ncbi:MAG: helix-turn-helix domain-containing protein [Rhodospirillaceae bacterium]